MAKLQGLQADYVFRGTEHVVRMTVNGSVLEVEVEDRLTTDQWRGEFDAAFIEDLTHKTGNFKQFGIFCSMLESALSQSQRAVTLDLLTYTDLEALRSRKIGVGPRHMPSASKSSLLSSKRYLILIYSVEFDRIHYPLPLPYVGKPDPVALQKVIRELKEELAVLKARPGRDFRDAEIRRLRDELSRVLEEKQEVETALLRLQAELKLCSKSSAGKEVNILKKIVQSLEEELLKERTKHQRLASKRLQENRQLADELAEVKASERSLRVRVKSLTNELALYKKGARCLESTLVPCADRPGSALLAKRISAASGRARRLTPTGPSPQNRSASSRGFSHAAPSRTGVRPPRFDPTAFVKAKERKQKEAELKNPLANQGGSGRWGGGMGEFVDTGSHLRAPVLAGSRSLASPPPNTSPSPVPRAVESFRSRRSSASSGSEAEDCSEPVPLSWGRRRAARGRKPLSASTWNGPSGVGGPGGVWQAPANACSSPPPENLYDEPSADLSEIDARLQALQEYMNNLDTRT
uniref:Centrosomal protein CCDC61 n=1 Tax=Pelodiscus sinensis TaxID=13735 RepID=K7FIY5_PELSI